MSKTTDIATTTPTAIALGAHQVDWRQHLDVIKAQYAKGSSDAEFAVFISTATSLGLSPLAKQIYLVMRPGKQGEPPTGTIQISIDGFRSIAERSGLYRGKTKTEWCGFDGKWVDVWLDPNEPPQAARVGVRRTGFDEPVYAVATLRAYAQKNRDGQLVKLWASMPDNMLAKCAEALALRQAFPLDLSGFYTPDEMGQAEPQEGAPRATTKRTTAAETARKEAAIDAEFDDADSLGWVARRDEVEMALDHCELTLNLVKRYQVAMKKPVITTFTEVQIVKWLAWLEKDGKTVIANWHTAAHPGE